MATVDQIRARLAAETGYYETYAPASSDTTAIPVVRPIEEKEMEEQVPLKPVRKVSAAGLAGAFSILVVFVLGYFGIEVTAEVASAITTIFAFGAGYLVPAATTDEQVVTN